MSSGAGTSGSTQWNNCYRSRLYFATLNQRDEEGSDIKTLQMMKNNRGPIGEKIRLFWENNVFKVYGSKTSLQRMAADAAVDDAFLKCLDIKAAQGVFAGLAPTGSNYAPRMFARMSEVSGITDKAFAASQERLLSAKRIIAVPPPGAPPSRQHMRILVRSNGA
jgi:hypothetical protein